MIMHLSTKSKGKPRFRNSSSAETARKNKEDWDKKVKEWSSFKPFSTTPARKYDGPSKSPVVTERYIDPSRSTKHIPSVSGGGYVPTARERKVYTGDKIIGIATLHKSNAVPVFSNEDAVEISRMRRG